MYHFLSTVLLVSVLMYIYQLLVKLLHLLFIYFLCFIDVRSVLNNLAQTNQLQFSLQ